MVVILYKLTYNINVSVTHSGVTPTNLGRYLRLFAFFYYYKNFDKNRQKNVLITTFHQKKSMV